MFKLSNELYNNKSTYGGDIYNPEENFQDKSRDILSHIYKGFEPGSLTSIKRAVKAYNEDDLGNEAIAQLLGLRTYDVDVAEQFGYKARDYTKRLANARKIYSDEFYNRDSTRESRIEKLISAGETASILGLKESTLAQFRWRGDKRLPWVKLGKSIRYKLSDIEAFIERSTIGKGV